MCAWQGTNKSTRKLTLDVARTPKGSSGDQAPLRWPEASPASSAFFPASAVSTQRVQTLPEAVPNRQPGFHNKTALFNSIHHPTDHHCFQAGEFHPIQHQGVRASAWISAWTVAKCGLLSIRFVPFPPSASSPGRWVTKITPQLPVCPWPSRRRALSAG